MSEIAKQLEHQAHLAHHRLSLDHRVGALRLHARLEFGAPWTVIFGPSGSGKSSLLRGVCGLIPASFAEREEAGWRDLSKAPVHRRKLAYAPQGAVLLPHLTVRGNVAFAGAVAPAAGPNERAAGPNEPAAGPNEQAARPNEAARRRVDEMLELFGLTDLAERLPRELSGGERQRVNLARAFAVPAPRLMLLDEPFTGFDRSLRDRLLPRLQELLSSRGIPAISVTHDIEEALMLDAEVVRLEAGAVVAQGSARSVLAEECRRAVEILGP